MRLSFRLVAISKVWRYSAATPQVRLLSSVSPLWMGLSPESNTSQLCFRRACTSARVACYPISLMWNNSLESTLYKDKHVQSWCYPGLQRIISTYSVSGSRSWLRGLCTSLSAAGGWRTLVSQVNQLLNEVADPPNNSLHRSHHILRSRAYGFPIHLELACPSRSHRSVLVISPQTHAL